MIGFGQLLSQALATLWRRRLPMLALVLAWLALDGLVLGYLKIFHPTFGVANLLWIPGVVAEDWLLSGGGFRFFVSSLPELLRDAVRAVFVVLILRSLLSPLPSGSPQRPIGPVGAVLLVFAFELIWTAILHPVDFALLRMMTDGSIDVVANPVLIPSIRSALFIV